MYISMYLKIPSLPSQKQKFFLEELIDIMCVIAIYFRNENEICYLCK